jgi:hypothetical protein
MIVGISGLIGSGKNTVSALLTEKYGFRKDSFAASLKDVCASMFDWPRDLLEGESPESRKWREEVDNWWSEKLNIPNLTPRLALQLMGTDVMRNHFNESVWFLTMENRIRKNPTQDVVISDVRFPNEIKFVQERGGVMIKVSRGPTPVWYETAIMANKGNSIAKEAMIKTYTSAHFSEWAWVGAKFDYEINNDTDVASLTTQVDKIITNIKI